MTIHELPIIAQLVDFFALIMNGIVFVASKTRIQHVALYIILFALFSELFRLPLTIPGIKKTRIMDLANKHFSKLTEKYTKSELPYYQSKINFEKSLILKRYGDIKDLGCLGFFIQFPFIIAMYEVINNLQTYVPYISSLSEDELLRSYSLFGLDIRNVPGATILGIFPLGVTLFQVISSLILDKLNNRPHNFAILGSCLLTAYIGFRFSTHLSIYWLAGNIFSFIFSVIFTLYYKHKDEQYFIDKQLKKINKDREKRELPLLTEPISYIDDVIERKKKNKESIKNENIKEEEKKNQLNVASDNFNLKNKEVIEN